MEASEALTYPATGAAMVRPRQVLSRQQRGEEKAASKADGGKTQAADAARYGPARAPWPRRGAWRSAPPSVATGEWRRQLRGRNTPNRRCWARAEMGPRISDEEKEGYTRTSCRCKAYVRGPDERRRLVQPVTRGENRKAVSRAGTGAPATGVATSDTKQRTKHVGA